MKALLYVLILVATLGGFNAKADNKTPFAVFRIECQVTIVAPNENPVVIQNSTQGSGDDATLDSTARAAVRFDSKSGFYLLSGSVGSDPNGLGFWVDVWTNGTYPRRAALRDFDLLSLAIGKAVSLELDGIYYDTEEGKTVYAIPMCRLIRLK